MRILRFIALACTLILASQAMAQPLGVRQADQIDILNHTQPQIYIGQQVIQITTSTQQQLDSVLPLVERVWSEATGVGPLDVQIKQTSLPAITDLGIPYIVLIEDLQRYTNANWAQIVQTQRQVNQLQQQRERGSPSAHDDLWFANYKPLNEITSYIENITTVHPDMANVNVIGQSIEGRDMFAITVSAPDSPENPRADRPVVYTFSTVHAREWIAPMTTSYYASKLVEDYDTDPRVRAILDSTRIVIVPMGNPDGYAYTWSTDRHWRKNRRHNGGSSFGVDINRNWGYEWGGPGSSGNPSSNTYRGTGPFSEPETIALLNVALILGDSLIAHMEYHSYSQLIMSPYGYTEDPLPEPEHSFFRQLTQELADIIESVHGKLYDPIQSSELYRHAGNAPDWFYGALGIDSLIIELRPRNADFNPDPINILPNAQENYEAFKHYLERVAEPFSIVHDSHRHILIYPPYEFAITIRDGQGELDQFTPTMFARTDPDDPFTPYGMSPSEDNRFVVSPQDIPCNSTVEYYFQAVSTDEQTIKLPRNGPESPFVTTIDHIITTEFDNFETVTDWIVGDPSDTATSGVWTRMDPEELLNSIGEIIQPENDHTPEGTTCWVTDGNAGDGTSVHGGTTTLISPILDANHGDYFNINFWYWISGRSNQSQYLQIDVSEDNGKTWRVASSRRITTTDSLWKSMYLSVERQSFHITDEIRLRFAVTNNNPVDIVEVAIDDFNVTYIGCEDFNDADLNQDGRLNYSDMVLFMQFFESDDPRADFNQDGHLDFVDISIFFNIFTGGTP